MWIRNKSNWIQKKWPSESSPRLPFKTLCKVLDPHSPTFSHLIWTVVRQTNRSYVALDGLIYYTTCLAHQFISPCIFITCTAFYAIKNVVSILHGICFLCVNKNTQKRSYPVAATPQKWPCTPPGHLPSETSSSIAPTCNEPQEYCSQSFWCWQYPLKFDEDLCHPLAVFCPSLRTLAVWKRTNALSFWLLSYILVGRCVDASIIRHTWCDIRHTFPSRIPAVQY